MEGNKNYNPHRVKNFLGLIYISLLKPTTKVMPVTTT